MKTKLFFLCLLFFLSAACLPGINLTVGSTPTARVITSTSQPLPSSTPTPLPVAPTPIPTQPEGLDRINIYLVAVGDNGASGKLIGCGDSLVPVEVRIEPTLGVLRAALNELFKLEGQIMYGQSGLYNALYLSDLSIADVAVIDGEARIDLQGKLMTGGECDIPRIEEQLRSTALQFSTVDRVSIRVNGVLLEELLDLRG
jgi:hypothetical protein